MPLELIFGKVVKSLRIKKGISQEQLALESTLGRSYISELENGKYQPTLTSIFDIAKALNMKAADLIRLVELEFDNQSH
ncbi:helix-turn-helix domain-containing protein [Paenibacillus ferrarius]|uniref:helix-turn-helix domain-containing protein n=1 Tax=Paenibacillus ferrarius TaxID=1469647 RepID=UPI003D2CC69B